MRIAIICTELGGVTAYTGGFGRQLESLLPAMSRMNSEIDVIMFPTSPVSHEGKRQFEDNNGIRIIVPTDRIYTSASASIRIAYAARKILRILNGQYCYDHIIAAEWVGAAALLGRHERGRLVTNLITSLVQIEQIEARPLPDDASWLDYVARASQKALERLQAKRSRLCVACSPAIGAWATYLWGLRNVKSIPNCINIEQVEGILSGDRSDSDTDELRLAYVGRLEERKGIIVLAQSFQKIVDAGWNVSLHLIGRDSDFCGVSMQTRIEQILEGPAAERVHFLGDCTYSVVLEQLSLATIAVFPSLWEAFGNVALEAKVVGVPVVVTTGSGFDFFNEAGVDCLKAKPGDIQSLTEALELLLSRPELRSELAKNAAESVRRYGSDAIASEWLSKLGDYR